MRIQNFDEFVNEPIDRSLTVYHSTLIDSAALVCQEGFIPGRKFHPGQEWAGKWSGQGTYFHTQWPAHELLNSGDSDTVWSCLIECQILIELDRIVPDEESSYKTAAEAILHKDSIVVLGTIPATQITRIHMLDTPEARALEEEFGGVPVQYHTLDSF